MHNHSQKPQQSSPNNWRESLDRKWAKKEKPYENQKLPGFWAIWHFQNMPQITYHTDPVNIQGFYRVYSMLQTLY